jgi:hypothetical protein
VDDDTGLGDLGQLDDFQVIAERLRMMNALAALTDRYRRLNQEMRRRVTLAWMVR